MEKCLDQKVNMVKPLLQKKEKNFTSHENRHVVVRDARPENKARKNWQGRGKSVRITSEISGQYLSLFEFATPVIRGFVTVTPFST